MQVNTVVGVISGEGEAAALRSPPNSAPAAPPAPVEEPKAAVPAGLSQDEAEGIERQQQGTVTEVQETGEQGRVRSSPLVRKIAKENNVNLAQVPGTGLGGRITKEDIEAFIAKHGKAAPAAAAAPAAPSAPAAPAPVAAPAAVSTPAPPAPSIPAPTGPMQPVGGVTPGEVRADVGHAQEDCRAHGDVEAHQRARARCVRD